jgi:hypothetical protein
MASMDIPNHEKIIRNNLTVYLRNRLNMRLDAEGVLVFKLKQLWEYITQKLNVEELEQRQEYAMRLIDGIVPYMSTTQMNTYIWDEDFPGYVFFFVEFNKADYDGTPTTACEQLSSAVAVGAYDLVPSLFDNAMRSTSYTTPRFLQQPLHAAIARKDVQMVRILLTCYKNVQGVALSQTRYEKIDAVDFAIQIGNMEVLELLLDEFNPWPSYVGKIYRQWWMERAMKLGSIPALDTLLKAQNGRKVWMTQKMLLSMSCCGTVAMINHYIAIGLMKVNKTYQHTSPLIEVTKRSILQNVDRIATLISAGADVNKAAGDGATALFIASKNRHRITMNYLLDQGAHTDTENWPSSRKDGAEQYLQVVLASRSATQLGASKSRK